MTKTRYATIGDKENVKIMETIIKYKGQEIKLATYGDCATPEIHQELINNPEQVLSENKEMFERILVSDNYTDEEKERARTWLSKFGKLV
jgi:glutamine phosphoribosylpyrophosphate amidotransferase